MKHGAKFSYSTSIIEWSMGQNGKMLYSTSIIEWSMGQNPPIQHQ